MLKRRRRRGGSDVDCDYDKSCCQGAGGDEAEISLPAKWCRGTYHMTATPAALSRKGLQGSRPSLLQSHLRPFRLKNGAKASLSSNISIEITIIMTMMRRRHAITIAIALLLLLSCFAHHLRVLGECIRTYATFYRLPHHVHRYHPPSIFSSSEEYKGNPSVLVPRILHQIYLSPEAGNLSASNHSQQFMGPTEYLPYRESCKNLHSHWQHMLWTQQRATAFMVRC